MKRLFNHTKRPVDEWEGYEEEEYDWDGGADTEDGEYDAGEGEYYADGEYAGEEEPYIEDAEEYTGETAEAGEYYAEDAEEYAGDEVYYAEEEAEYAGAGEYYTEDAEEYAGETAEAGEYYAEDAEEYAGAGEYYTEDAEEYAEDEVYYAEEEAEYAEAGEYYAENAEEYAGDEVYYAEEEAEYDEGGEIYYKKQAGRGAGHGRTERYPEKKKKNAVMGVLLAKLRDMSAMDRAIAGMGAAVLVLLMVTGGAFISSRIVQSQVSDFVSVGSQLDGISMIGESGLLAVADAQMARIAAAEMVGEEAAKGENEGYEENEYSRQVTVAMNMTSIQKDLKIKFTNKKTGKLIANVPFSVTVTDPDGKTSIWSDDDMDGIIYKKDITPGTYTVAMEELTDDKYADYSVSTEKRSVEVKKNIAYEKVDVADEVKSESEIDVNKEDTAQNEIQVESALQDTVAWVESKVISAVYSEVAKSTIPDPLTLASVRGNFLRMTVSAGISSSSLELEVGKTAQLKPQATAAPDGENEVVEGEVQITNIAWNSSAPNVATVGTDGTVTALAAGSTTISYTATASYTVRKTDVTVSGSDSAAGTTDTRTTQIQGTCMVTVKDTLTKGSLTVDKPSVAVVVKGTAAVQATANNFTKDRQLVYTAASDKTSVATATVDAAGKVTITGVASGTAKITVTANYKDGATDATAASVVINVTVGANKVITFEKDAYTAYVANPIVLNAVIKNATTKTPKVTVESSDATVLKASVGTLKEENNGITAPITLEPLKTGSVTLTVKCVENGEEVKASCVVTVKANPKEDVTTALKDNQGNLLYVLENNEYRQAVYADYYKFDKFYVKTGEKYTGWQTIDGKVYYFDAEGNKVTGEQVIQGAKYAFASDGSLVTGSGTLGIDVSKWNGNIDWAAVKNSGINYVIIRCGYRGSSQGSLIEDPKFTANIKGATAAGLKVGVYFFTQAIDEREAVEEASMVLEQIKNYKISYPVFLDVEASGGRADSISKETRTAVCKAFCQTIQNAGYTAGIYANKNWLENKIDPSALSAYKIWLAQYAAAPTYTGRYDLWQYRSTGKVTGISGNVDMNLSYLGY